MSLKTSIRFCLLPIVAATLAACGGGSGSDDTPPAPACAATGPYACQTGATEPLYTFQWALNYAASYFKDFPETFSGGMDLNVEPVHRQEIKGQGVRVLVLDSGTDLANEDLAPNADLGMSWNFKTLQPDPFPDLTDPDFAPHGTVVAGIIGAAQNGKGVMGIAPRATLGGANLLSSTWTAAEIYAAYGGAPWSSQADVFNASYGGDSLALPYDTDTDVQTSALRGLKKLRDGKGAVFLKASGNAFDGGLCGLSKRYYDCTNPANDRMTLESNIITVAALNTMGQASSYSSAGAVVWVTGMAGEYGSQGVYGEGMGVDRDDGPTIYGTDLTGCKNGYSRNGARTPFLRGETQRNGQPDNANCDYTYMNGTSSATPTLSGVAALILSANPALTWRDVRDILRLSARKVDADYARRVPTGSDKPYGALMSLNSNQFLNWRGAAADIQEGAIAVPVELGWQKNAAGLDYSNWYGFGVPDAEKAVELAQAYKADPSRSRGGDVKIPDFKLLSYWQRDPLAPPPIDVGDAEVTMGDPFPYKTVRSAADLRVTDEQVVDQFQVRLSGNFVCLGSLGIAVKSPSGTVSILKLPNDHFRADGVYKFENYALSSMAFYGEQAKGNWEILTLASNPDEQIEIYYVVDGKRRIRMSEKCPWKDDTGKLADFTFAVEGRVIAQ